MARKIKVKFKEMEDNIDFASVLADLCPDGLYLAVSDSIGVSREEIREAIAYCRETAQLGGLGDYFNFGDGFFPGYQEITSTDIKGYSNTDYIYVSDLVSLNFFLSYSGGEREICIFSNDFDIHEVSTLYSKYLEYCENDKAENVGGIKFYQHILNHHLHVFEGRRMALIDTYADDEDSNNYLLISSDSDIYGCLESKYGSVPVGPHHAF